jgi:hypothetical protein
MNFAFGMRHAKNKNIRRSVVTPRGNDGRRRRRDALKSPAHGAQLIIIIIIKGKLTVYFFFQVY